MKTIITAILFTLISVQAFAWTRILGGSWDRNTKQLHLKLESVNMCARPTYKVSQSLTTCSRKGCHFKLQRWDKTRTYCNEKKSTVFEVVIDGLEIPVGMPSAISSGTGDALMLTEYGWRH